MANSKTFVLMNDTTVEKIGEHLVTWFQNSKNMIAEGCKAQDGYFVQAKDQDDGWKKISGLSKALQVQLIKAENNVIVNCDFGKWSDKVGAGAVGMVLFAPLAVTAAVGAMKQSKLPEEVFSEVEKFIMYGGTSAVVSSVGQRLNENEVLCPVCKAKNPKGQKFCIECGSPLGKTCPHCGASISDDVKFCPECGNSVSIETKCIHCGKPLSEGQKFCPFCGTKQEKTCPQCGTVLEPGAKFCPSCGASTSVSSANLCPNCKSELNPDDIFCKNCGTKVK